MVAKLPPASIPEPSNLGTVAALFGEIGLALIAPEIGVPALIGTILVGGLAVGTAVAASQVAINVSGTVDNCLGIILKLKRLGWINDSEDPLKQIADRLQFKDADDKTWSIGELLYKMAIFKGDLDYGDTVEPMDTYFAEQLTAIQRQLYWKTPAGRHVPLSESLGKLVFTGVVSSYRNFPGGAGG